MSSNVCIFTKQRYSWVQNYSHVSIYVYVNVYFVSKKMFIFIFVNLNFVFKIILRLNLINHYIGFISCQFACNSALSNPVLRWKSCKGSVWENVKKSLRMCTQQGTRDWISRLASRQKMHMSEASRGAK